MSWLVLSFVTLALWGSYAIFATRANAVHGELVTLLFEAGAFVGLVLVQFSGIRSNLERMTWRSAFDATCMAAMSTIGFYLLLRALRIEPTRVGTIVLITGLYPVVTVLASALTGQQQLDAKDWLGAALATAGIVLVSI